MTNQSFAVRLKKALDARDIPIMVICDWEIKHCQNGNSHLVGHDIVDKKWRVSSPIKRKDLERCQVETMSGRLYVLDGPSKTTIEGEALWDEYKKAYKIVEDGHEIVL